MNATKFLKIFAMVAALILTSCQNKPIRIVIVGSSDISDTLIFNAKDTIITRGILDSVFLKPSAIHSVSVNNSKGKTFKVGRRGGILNLHSKEFVVFTVDYEKKGPEGDKRPLFEIDLCYYMLLDSSIVCKKGCEPELRDPFKLSEILDSLVVKKNGNYKPMMDERHRRFEGDFDTTKVVNGFKKIGKDRFYLDKFWDIDIFEEIPSEITTITSSESKNYNQKRTQIAIVSGEDFLTNATIWKNEFAVIDVRLLMKNRKRN